jgi:hypothetical protein
MQTSQNAHTIPEPGCTQLGIDTSRSIVGIRLSTTIYLDKYTYPLHISRAIMPHVLLRQSH